MKILLLLCLILLPACGFCESSAEIWTATDMHYIAPMLTDHGAYFTKLVENADGKTMMYSEEVMDAFVAQIIDRHPQALILSGDLTFNGARQSHEALAAKLETIEAAGIPVFVIPGNHDLYSGSAARFEGDGYERVESVTREEFEAIYHAFGPDDALAHAPDSMSYTAALSENLRLLMLDTNTKAAPNAVSEATLSWVSAQLADAKSAECEIIAVSHQNLVTHSSLISTGFTIQNADVLVRLYADAPVLCNLSGHIHLQHMGRTDAGLWDIATSSLAVSPNQYGVLTLTDDALTYHTESVDVSVWAEARRLSDPNLLHFAEYARDFFAQTSRRQALASIAEDEAPEELADFFAALNAAYFAGRMDAFETDEALLNRWRKQNGFLAMYVESVAGEERGDWCEAVIER